MFLYPLCLKFLFGLFEAVNWSQWRRGVGKKESQCQLQRMEWREPPSNHVAEALRSSTGSSPTNVLHQIPRSLATTTELKLLDQGDFLKAWGGVSSLQVCSSNDMDLSTRSNE